MPGTASYDPSSLLLRPEPVLLGKFAELHSLDFVPKKGENGEDMAERFLNVLQRLNGQDGEAFGEVLGALNDISDLSGRVAIEYLLNTAEKFGAALDRKTIDKLPNHHSRSLWFFLNLPRIFSAALDERQLDDVGSWKGLILPPDQGKQLLAAIGKLEQLIPGVITFNLGKTRCKVKIIQREGRVCLVAYVEDCYVNDLEFKKDDRVGPDRPRRPVQRIYIQFWKDGRQLEVKIRGGQTKVDHLQRIVVEGVLGLSLLDCHTSIYRLDVLRNLESEPLAFADEPDVVSVGLKSLNIRRRIDGHTLILNLYGKDIEGTGGMAKLLRDCNLDPDYIDVTKAKIKVILSINGVRRPVTFDIGHGDGKGHNLKSRNHDLRVRQLLKKWGIDTSPSKTEDEKQPAENVAAFQSA